MNSPRRNINAVILVACLAGYAYLFYSMNFTAGGTLCLFKKLSGIACPSCGSTRAVVALLHGRVSDSFYYYNPIGMLIAPVMLASPVWLVRDLLQKENSLLSCYRKLEKLLLQPSVYLPAIVLLLANWVWTIMKGL